MASRARRGSPARPSPRESENEKQPRTERGARSAARGVSGQTGARRESDRAGASCLQARRRRPRHVGRSRAPPAPGGAPAHVGGRVRGDGRRTRVDGEGRRGQRSVLDSSGNVRRRPRHVGRCRARDRPRAPVLLAPASCGAGLCPGAHQTRQRRAPYRSALPDRARPLDPAHATLSRLLRAKGQRPAPQDAGARSPMSHSFDSPPRFAHDRLDAYTVARQALVLG